MNRAGLRRATFLAAKRLLFPGLDIATRKRMALARYFRPGPIATLDAGCGNGAFSYYACRLGNAVVGVDFDPDKLAGCEEFRDSLRLDPAHCRFVKHNLYDLVALHERFDQIICFETLEHLADDRAVIRQFYQVANPGAWLHVCTPRANRNPYYGERISEVEDGGHVRLGYTHEQLEAMLRDEGFRPLRRDQ